MIVTVQPPDDVSPAHPSDDRHRGSQRARGFVRSTPRLTTTRGGVVRRPTVVVALLHDVVEKGQSSLADLLAVVRDERVVHLVDILTRRRGESEEEYLSRCAADPVALAIKRADLTDKHFHGDAQVDHETAQRLGQEAQERLDLLDLLAGARGEADFALTLSQDLPPGRG